MIYFQGGYILKDQYFGISPKYLTDQNASCPKGDDPKIAAIEAALLRARGGGLPRLLRPHQHLSQPWMHSHLQKEAQPCSGRSSCIQTMLDPSDRLF